MKLFLVTKKYEMTLFDYLRNNPHLEISKRLDIWSKVAGAIQAQHQSGIINFDVKSNNVYVSLEQNDVKELVVADFGIGSGDEYVYHHYGTPGFGAPEQFTSAAYQESDIFALGKLSLQIIFPFDTFWAIIGTPVDQSAIEKFRKTHKVFEKFHDLVSAMLQVGRDRD